MSLLYHTGSVCKVIFRNLSLVNQTTLWINSFICY